MKMIALFLGSLVSGLFYRLGGDVETKIRDIGCPLVGFAIMQMVVPKTLWQIHLLSGLLFFGALTTYWDSVFGYDNHYIHSLICGLAYLPYIYAGIGWEQVLIRSIVLMFLTGIWSKVEDNAVREEVGRGILLILTLGILVL